MTIWYPDTCGCTAHVEDEILIVNCKLHNTYQETLLHNQSFNKSNKTSKQKQTEKLRIKNL